MSNSGKKGSEFSENVQAGNNGKWTVGFRECISHKAQGSEIPENVQDGGWGTTAL